MQNLTDSELSLFIGFLVLCVCVLFMLRLCFKHSCLHRRSHSENHVDSPNQNFSTQLYRPSPPNIPNISTPQVAKKKQIWVDTTLKDERQNTLI